MTDGPPVPPVVLGPGLAAFPSPGGLRSGALELTPHTMHLGGETLNGREMRHCAWLQEALTFPHGLLWLLIVLFEGSEGIAV